MTAELKDLYEKPERFGDGDMIYLRQIKVSSTFDLKTVTGHEVMTEAEMWVAGWGVTRITACLPKAPKGLELDDQSLPLGGPWPKEERKPHVPVKPVYNRKTRSYPGALSLFVGMVGWHTPEMSAAFLGYDKWCEATGRRSDTGCWTGNFFRWLQGGSQKDSELWEQVGSCNSAHTTRIAPMMKLLRAHFEAEIKPLIKSPA